MINPGEGRSRMDYSQRFKTAVFGGFNKEDVVTYIEGLAQEREALRAERDELSARCDELGEKAGRQADRLNSLEEAEARAKGLAARVEELEKHLAEIDEEGLKARARQAEAQLENTRTALVKEAEEKAALASMAESIVKEHEEDSKRLLAGFDEEREAMQARFNELAADYERRISELQGEKSNTEGLLGEVSALGKTFAKYIKEEASRFLGVDDDDTGDWE